MNVRCDSSVCSISRALLHARVRTSSSNLVSWTTTYVSARLDTDAPHTELQRRHGGSKSTIGKSTAFIQYDEMK
jgi:hypothetical protein